MKLKERIKTYNFWVSLSSAIFLTLKLLGHQFGFHVDESLFSDLITSLCSILVILGIIVPPTKSLETNIKVSNYEEENKHQNDVTPIQDETYDVDKSNTTDIYTNENQNFSEEIIIDNKEKEFETISNTDNQFYVIDYETEKMDGQENLSTENEISDNDNNFEDIKSQFNQILSEHERFFENNINQYIEILQNKINNLNNK